MRLRLSFKFTRTREALGRVYAWLSRHFEGRVPHGHLAPAEALKQRRWPLFAYSALLAITVGGIVVSVGPRAKALPQLQAGDIAEQNIYSPITADIEPRQLPARSREELYRKVAPVFDYDETAVSLWLQNWSKTFAMIRQQFFDDKKTEFNLQLADRVGEILLKETGQSVNTTDLLFLIKNRFSKEIEDLFQELGKPLLGRLISQTDLFPSYYSTGIVVRQINLGLNETLVTDVSRIWSLDHAKQLVNHVLSSSIRNKNEKMQRMAAMVQNLVIPNLKFNSDQTENRINTALGRKEIPLVSLHKGQILIRIGERINESHVETLEALRHLATRAVHIKRFTLTALIVFLLMQILLHLDLTRRSFVRLNLRNALIFAGLVVVTLSGIKLALPFVQVILSPLGIRYGGEYFMPVAASAVLIHLLMGAELAYTFSFLIALTSALLLERNLFYGIWVLVVMATAVQSIGSCKQRTDLYKSGAWSGLVGALLAVAFDLHQSLGLYSLDWVGLITRATLSFLSGMLASIVASTLIPIFESILGFTTNLKLLELSNFNHPLLHNLMMKAPGTYHHSIMVGSLAEIAADQIKANSLLARVSAYYHDIGKMVNPLYFIENQSPQYNPHDHLSPSISARILFSHVKNGARMGREHNLGDVVNDIIQQHHGTTLATFFYNKAKEQQNTAESQVSEMEYRYPGPRPQSREAAIVMIADACEASTRSILDPTPAKIQGMVHNIINKRFLDQQFHDCDLTLKDLQIIEDSISRTLLSLYHHRIEYPGQQQDLNNATTEMARKSP